VRAELQQFEGTDLSKKPEIVVLTKSDTRDAAYIDKVRGTFAKKGIKVEVVSVLDDTQVKALGDTIVAALRKNQG
jgi:GTPase involved in cell partitioning and DNA repair